MSRQQIEQILYDETGMIAENHPSIVKALEAYAESKLKEQGSVKEVKWMVYHKKYVEWLTKYNGRMNTMEAGMSKPNQPDYFRANND